MHTLNFQYAHTDTHAHTITEKRTHAHLNPVVSLSPTFAYTYRRNLVRHLTTNMDTQHGLSMCQQLAHC